MVMVVMDMINKSHNVACNLILNLTNLNLAHFVSPFSFYHTFTKCVHLTL